MWILFIALACGQGDAPQPPPPAREAPPEAAPPSRSPHTTPVQQLSAEQQVEAGNIAANALLGRLLDDAAVRTCVISLQGSGRPARVGFHMRPGGSLELIFESGDATVDECVQQAHAEVDYSSVTLPVPFEVETSVPL